MLTKNSTFADLVIELKTNGKAVVREVGTFTVRDTPERQGRNPATGESMMIPAGRRVTFKASPALKGEI